MIDPLEAFIADRSSGEGRAIPLVSTRFDVEIAGGLATVVTTRVFRNDEVQSVEATITFPVPVHAVMFDLQARVDGRVVRARAQRRAEARASYEDAVEGGKTAVLHEEVLRGVHMLSVAHLGPGKEIEVSATWVAALSFAGDRGHLGIPLTVGQIYGRSPLPDSDDLVTSGPVQSGDLFVRCGNGVVEVRAARLHEGHTRIALNAPIDIFVTGAARQDLHGVAADGREVTLRVFPHGGGDGALDVAVVVDRSGSMNAGKHRKVVRGLRNVAQGLREGDVVDLWEFDDRLDHVGSSQGPGVAANGRQRLIANIARLGAPRGGTEIGAALSGTMARSEARDVLLITDGRSHALDVHALAQRGRRITVVLVGDDSLEANVGHLAALSGGDIFVAAGDDIAQFLAAAIAALRAPCERPGPADAPPERVRVVRANAVLEALWRPVAGPAAAAAHRGVAAMAASLVVPSLGKEQAAVFAEAEGLVTHLTSLVLVDEEGDVQEGVPATRKVALPAPAVVIACRERRRVAAMAPEVADCALGSISSSDERAWEVELKAVRPVPGWTSSPVPRWTSSRIDWNVSPNRLIAGDLSVLDQDDVVAIRFQAQRPEVIALAQRLGIDPVALVVAALAHAQSATNRSAARVAKAILGNRSRAELGAIVAMFRL
jgi:hypothetical protein